MKSNKVVMTGVDLSHWNLWNSPEKAKTEGGVQFAMLKIGGSDNGYYKDPKFDTFYDRCVLNSIYVGVYFFVGSSFKTYAEGEKAGNYVLKLLRGRKLSMPVVIDVEKGKSKYKVGQTDAVLAFQKVIEKAGYYAMVYGSDVATFKNMLDLSRLKGIDKWVARYGKEPENVADCGMWQWTSSGKVAGFFTFVDCNRAYKNYPEIIAGMNKKGGKK